VWQCCPTSSCYFNHCVMPPCEYKKYKKVHSNLSKTNKSKKKSQLLSIDVVPQQLEFFLLQNARCHSFTNGCTGFRLCTIDTCHGFVADENIPTANDNQIRALLISHLSISQPVQPAYDFYGEQPRPEKRESRNKDIYNIITPNTVYEWRTGRWSECSVTCGPGGQKIRSVRCANMSSKDKELVDDTYCSMAKPASVESCTHFRCPQWIMGRWGEVSG
jgi:Thrombospondin type 1 domain